MPFKTYILRFPSEQSRNKFRTALDRRSDIDPDQVEFGEFLPDVIVRNISDRALDEIKSIVDPGTRFIEDFRHDLLRP